MKYNYVLKSPEYMSKIVFTQLSCQVPVLEKSPYIKVIDKLWLLLSNQWHVRSLPSNIPAENHVLSQIPEKGISSKNEIFLSH